MLPGTETGCGLDHRSDDFVSFQETGADFTRIFLVIFVNASPSKMKKHSEVPMHKVVLNCIRVSAVS